MTMNVRQTASGSRVTIAAARSQLSSAARAHSSSAARIARTGRPARSGRRTPLPSPSRICSAVPYRTWSLRMCAASCASTTRSPWSPSRSTVELLSTTIGCFEPITAAFTTGHWVR